MVARGHRDRAMCPSAEGRTHETTSVGATGPAGHHVHAHPPGEAVTDPVCGMKVDPHKTQYRATQQGRAYYFCSAGCQAKFSADPAKYLAAKTGRASENVPEGAIYTCPMHPEIRQVGPGNCPICGMALE